MAKRREDVDRFIGETTEPVSSGEIAEALGMSATTVLTALRRLMDEGRISRVGAHAATKYTVRRGLDSVRTGSDRSPTGSEGTLQGLIAEIIKERSSATAEELAQALRVPLDRIHAECAALQREGEICMSNRDGKPVYVLKVKL
jgi:predicted ArsR family transcriptional regulator